MSKRNLVYLTLCFFVCLGGTVLAQAQTPLTTRQRPLTVTASVTDEQVRFAALTDVSQLRLEVLSAAGAKLYVSEFKFGNMLDWDLRDQHGQLLADGLYQCVVTARDYAGRLIERRGQVAVQGGQASLQTPEQTENALQAPNPLSALERPDFLALLAKEAGLGMTLLAHDGKEGRLVSGSGDLSFRLGNFFAGKDVEQMRLTPEGNLGLGVRAPQYKLDVAGLIRTSEGIMFPDGTVQTTAAAGISPSAALGVAVKQQGLNALAPNAPAVTVNSLAKFFSQTTVGDSNVFEVGGFVGIGTQNPQGQLHIFGTPDQDIFNGIGQDLISGPGFNFGYSGASFGRSSGFFNVRPDALAVAPNPSLRFLTLNQLRMIITNLGNVGIGTLNPAFPLSVAGIIQSTSGGFRFPDGTVQTTAAAGGGGVTSVSASAPLASSGGANPNISLTGAVPIANGGTGGTTGAILNSVALQTANFNITGNGLIGGNAGIGTTSPAFKLAVVTGSNVYGIAHSAGTVTGALGSTAAGGVFLGAITNHNLNFVANNSTNMTILPNGNVGIGTSGPPDKLSLAITGTGVGYSLTNGTVKLDTRVNSTTVAAIGTMTNHPLNFYTNNGAAQMSMLTNGNVQVFNNLSKGGGSFKIDHPLEPENKYLYHSFVESPDMMNIYNGNVTTDENGLAEVALPDWFETLNRDFRYQLTVIGQFAQAIVAEKVKDNRFKIRTSIPNVEISWQVTGIRRDPYANANRIQVEEDKPKEERGTYLHAEAYGQPPEKSLRKKNGPQKQQ